MQEKAIYVPPARTSQKLGMEVHLNEQHKQNKREQINLDELSKNFNLFFDIIVIAHAHIQGKEYKIRRRMMDFGIMRLQLQKTNPMLNS